MTKREELEQIRDDYKTRKEFEAFIDLPVPEIDQLISGVFAQVIRKQMKREIMQLQAMRENRYLKMNV